LGLLDQASYKKAVAYVADLEILQMYEKENQKADKEHPELEAVCFDFLFYPQFSSLLLLY